MRESELVVTEKLIWRARVKDRKLCQTLLNLADRSSGALRVGKRSSQHALANLFDDWIDNGAVRTPRGCSIPSQPFSDRYRDRVIDAFAGSFRQLAGEFLGSGMFNLQSHTLPTHYHAG
jgi:hypothetical protein